VGFMAEGSGFMAWGKGCESVGVWVHTIFILRHFSRMQGMLVQGYGFRVCCLGFGVSAISDFGF